MAVTIGFSVKILALGLGQITQKSVIRSNTCGGIGGECLYDGGEVGFEPTIPVKVCRISSAVHSTTLHLSACLVGAV